MKKQHFLSVSFRCVISHSGENVIVWYLVTHSTFVLCLLSLWNRFESLAVSNVLQLRYCFLFLVSRWKLVMKYLIFSSYAIGCLHFPRLPLSTLAVNFHWYTYASGRYATKNPPKPTDSPQISRRYREWKSRNTESSSGGMKNCVVCGKSVFWFIYGKICLSYRVCVSFGGWLVRY